MNKTEFIFELGKRLEGLPKEDIIEKLAFYSEMIDDRIEDGASEEEAIAGLGSPEKVAEEIIADYPLGKIVKQKVKSQRRLKDWEIVLICVGFPVWLPLLAVAFSVAITFYAVIWSLVVVAWAAVFGTLAGCAVAGAVGGAIIASTSHFVSGIVLLAAGLVCGGLAIFSFFGCTAATKGVANLTKKIAIGIKRMFIRKGEA